MKKKVNKIGINIMKTIEERADAYVGHPFEIDEFSSTTAKRQAFIDGAKEQKQLTLEAFDEWLCRNSWITRDEDNRKPLEEFRNTIKNIK